jgi:hypothetical protein
MSIAAWASLAGGNRGEASGYQPWVILRHWSTYNAQLDKKTPDAAWEL